MPRVPLRSGSLTNQLETAYQGEAVRKTCFRAEMPSNLNNKIRKWKREGLSQRQIAQRVKQSVDSRALELYPSKLRSPVHRSIKHHHRDRPLRVSHWIASVLDPERVPSSLPDPGLAPYSLQQLRLTGTITSDGSGDLAFAVIPPIVNSASAGTGPGTIGRISGTGVFNGSTINGTNTTISYGQSAAFTTRS